MALLSKDLQTRTPKTQTDRRAPLRSYYRAESSSNSSPFKKKPVQKNRRKFLFGFLDIVLVLLLVFGLLYSLLLSPHPKVITDNQFFRPTADYAAVAAQQFSSLKNRNKITFDEQAVVDTLQKQFPEISSAQIERPFFSQQATIRLTISKPSFQLSSAGSSYIVGSNGVIVAKSVSLPNIKNLVTVDDQSGFNARVGQPVLSANATAFINTVTAECRHAKVPIATLVLPATPEELDLKTTDQPYYIKFYLGGSVLDETGQFLAARQHFIQTNQAPSAYLDVRVAGKVFYK
jgi:cell division septal protein FtsQ